MIDGDAYPVFKALRKSIFSFQGTFFGISYCLYIFHDISVEYPFMLKTSPPLRDGNISVFFGF